MCRMANKDFRSLLNLLAFIAIGLVGVALLLSKVGLGGEISSALTLVANLLAYIITAVAAFYFVRNKNNVWLWVVYAVALVLIVISYII